MVETRPNWGFELGDFKVRVREPTADEILNAYYENLVPKQERFRKMRKHGDVMGDPSLAAKLAVEISTDQHLAFYSAATYEPHMSISELRNTKGRTWTLFERFVDRVLGSEEVKFRADGPGIEELSFGGESSDKTVVGRVSTTSTIPIESSSFTS